MEQHIISLLTELACLLTKQGWMLATAESCTGGGIAHTITKIPDCSLWFERGFVAYSNDAKHDMLGVSKDIIKKYTSGCESTGGDQFVVNDPSVTILEFSWQSFTNVPFDREHLLQIF